MAVVDSPFSEEEKVALVKHLNWALGEAGGAPDEHVGARLPLNPHTDSWLEALPDGLPLSKFVMHVDPEALDARALNIPKDGAPLSDKDALQVTTPRRRRRLHHRRHRLRRRHRLTSSASLRCRTTRSARTPPPASAAASPTYSPSSCTRPPTTSRSSFS
jgi:hypothetical protein